MQQVRGLKPFIMHTSLAGEQLGPDRLSRAAYWQVASFNEHALFSLLQAELVVLHHNYPDAGDITHQHSSRKPGWAGPLSVNPSGV